MLSRLRSSRPPIFYGWVIVGTALTMNLAASPLNAAIFSFFITPMSEDLGWSRADLSWGYTVRLAVAGVSGPVLGVLLDRFGSRVLGSIAGLLAGFSVLALAGVHSLFVFYLLFAISGLAGFGAPAGQLLTTVPVSKWFHVNRGRALALATVGLPLGTTIFIPITQALIDRIGWRETWAISGVLVIVLIALPCALLMRKDPESMSLHPDGLDHPPQIAAAAIGDLSTSEDWTASQVLRSPAMWMIVAAMTFSGLVLPGTVVYRVSFWEDQGLSSGMIAAATAIDPLTVTLSALVCGVIAERVQTRYLGFAGGIIVGCSMLAMIFARDSVVLLLTYNIPGASAWAPTSRSTTLSGPTTSAGASSEPFGASSSRSPSAPQPSARRSSPSCSTAPQTSATSGSCPSPPSGPPPSSSSRRSAPTSPPPNQRPSPSTPRAYSDPLSLVAEGAPSVRQQTSGHP